MQVESFQKMLNAIYETVQDAIFVLTPEGNLVDCNKTALSMFGISDKSSFFPGGPVQFSPPVQPDGKKSVDKAKEILREVLSTKLPVRFEWLHQRPDGSLFPAEVSISFFELEGRILLVATTRDISERKKFLDKLEKERKEMLSIFNEIDECIYVSDTETYEILFVNKKLKELIAKDLTGKICYEEFQGRTSPCPFCTNSIIKNIRPNSFVWEFYNPLIKRWFYLTDKIISWPDGRDVRFELAIDITEKKQMEEEKAKLESRLVQIQRLESLGRLAGGIAHDFNNILNIIVGRTQLAKQKTDSENLRKELNQILEAAKRATGIIQQILGFARKQVTKPAHVDLNNLIYHSLKVLGSIVGGNIKVRFEQGKDLWKVFIDPVQVDQILSNLIVNAKDAIQGHGEIVIKTENLVIHDDHPEFRKEMKKGAYVMLSVSDTGHGISPEIQNKIFEPFFTTKEPGKGTGLGLATVYGIVKQNNGYIYVESTPNKGTTFKIFIPKANPKEPVRTEERKHFDIVSFEGKTVFVVEDDCDLMKSTSDMLKTLGFEVMGYTSPKDALVQLAKIEKKIDLLLADVIMPEMYGPALYLLIKDFRPDMRVLFTSGYADLVKEEIKEYGELLEENLKEGRSFLGKPFCMEELIQKLTVLFSPQKR